MAWAESSQPSESPEPAESPAPEETHADNSPDACLDYQHNGSQYTIIASHAMGAESSADSMYICEHTISQGQSFYSSSRLFVFRDGENAAGEFYALVDSINVHAVPQGSSHILEMEDCWSPEEHPESLYCTGYYFSDESFDNLLVWEIIMKNGDVLTLKQQIKVYTRPEVSYHFDDYPMETLRELNVLLSRIYTTVDTDTVVNIYLPPVVYDGGLELTKRGINLYGCTDPYSGVQTTFTDTVIISGFPPTLPEIMNITFDTGGQEKGLHLGCSVMAQDCTFRNCSTGVYAGKGGWLIGWSCVFSGNETGLWIDNPEGCQVLNTRYDNCLFEENGLAIFIESTHSDFAFSFPNCTFRGNVTDIENGTDKFVDTSEAIFE